MASRETLRGRHESPLPWQLATEQASGMTQRAYNVWTAREVEALKRGVQVHGVGFWEQIRNDPQFEVLR